MISRGDCPRAASMTIDLDPVRRPRPTGSPCWRRSGGRSGRRAGGYAGSVSGVPGGRRRRAPGPPGAGRWSVIECVAHLVDGELIVAARNRWILAEDEPDIVGYDQALWVRDLGQSGEDPERLLAVFEALRGWNLDLWARTPASGARSSRHPPRARPESYELTFRLAAGHDRIHLAQARRALEGVADRPAGTRASMTAMPEVGSERVFLVGMVGSGKTTVGRALAERTGWPYVDNDDLVRQLTGREPAEIDATDGEDVLHLAELRALDVALEMEPPVVVGVAGVVVDDDAAREALREGGHVVWLQGAAGDAARADRRPGRGDAMRPSIPTGSGRGSGARAALRRSRVADHRRRRRRAGRRLPS